MSASGVNVPCWLVWKKADDGGRPYLVAICTTEAISRRYVKMLREEAKMLDKPVLVQVEESFLDHLYGESMGQGFDAMRKVMSEIGKPRR